jgi:hypothetical protein
MFLSPTDLINPATTDLHHHLAVGDDLVVVPERILMSPRGGVNRRICTL